MNAKSSVFVICVEAVIYLLLYNLHDCTVNGKLHFCEVNMKEWGACKQKLLQLVQWNK